MQTIALKKEQHAGLWGADPQGVAATLQEWEKDWADARALLSISHEMGVDIMILTRGDRNIEIISATGALTGQRPMWLLHFSDGHYDAVIPQAPNAIAAVCNAITLNPWRRQDQPPKKGGGQPVDAQQCRVVVDMFARRLEISMPRNDPTTGSPWQWEDLVKALLGKHQASLPAGVTGLRLMCPKGTDSQAHYHRCMQQGQDLVVGVLVRAPSAPANQHVDPPRGEKTQRPRKSPQILRHRPLQKV